MHLCRKCSRAFDRSRICHRRRLPSPSCAWNKQFNSNSLLTFHNYSLVFVVQQWERITLIIETFTKPLQIIHCFSHIIGQISAQDYIFIELLLKNFGYVRLRPLPPQVTSRNRFLASNPQIFRFITKFRMKIVKKWSNNYIRLSTRHANSDHVFFYSYSYRINNKQAWPNCDPRTIWKKLA